MAFSGSIDAILKAPVVRIVVAQFIVTILAAILCLTLDRVTAYSVLLGGLTSAIPSAFMAWRLNHRVAAPAAALKYLVRGELGKLAMTAVMFTGVFLWVNPLEVKYYFVALVLVMSCNMLVPLIEARAALKLNKGNAMSMKVTSSGESKR